MAFSVRIEPAPFSKGEGRAVAGMLIEERRA